MMDQITVRKAELLEKLRANRTAHRDIFLEAQIGYRAQVIEVLDKMLADAREGKKIRTHIQLVEPQDMTSYYDRAIAMLEMDINDEVTLDSHEFSCYVLDQWEWSQKFFASNSMYSDTARRMSS